MADIEWDILLVQCDMLHGMISNDIFWTKSRQ